MTKAFAPKHDHTVRNLKILLPPLLNSLSTAKEAASFETAPSHFR